MDFLGIERNDGIDKIHCMERIKKVKGISERRNNLNQKA